MSNSSLVSYTRISPNRNSPRKQPIRKITLHHMAGSMSLEAFGALVAKPSRQMSANYAIDTDGSIGLFCPEADRSWCSSSRANDQQAITVEIANDGGAPDWHVSDAALEAEIRTAQQTQAKIRQAYEYLLEAMEIVTPGSQEGNVAASKVLENLALLQEYLGPQGQEIYQSLIEGE